MLVVVVVPSTAAGVRTLLFITLLYSDTWELRQPIGSRAQLEIHPAIFRLANGSTPEGHVTHYLNTETAIVRYEIV